MIKVFYLNYLFLIVIQPFSVRADQPFKTSEKQYLTQTEHQFNLRNFDSCIRISYLLAHLYDTDKDYKKETDVWYSISYLYLLLDKDKEAGISEKMAGYYARRTCIDTSLYMNIYRGIANYYDENYENAHRFFRLASHALPIANKRLDNLIALFDADAADHIMNSGKQKLASEYQLAILKLHNDTDWFGYPLAYYNIGLNYFAVDRYNQSIRAFKDCINQYERLHIYTSNWLDAYTKLLSEFDIYKEQYSIETTFRRVILIMNKNNSQLLAQIPDYFFLKANLYYYHSDFQKALDLYIDLYNHPNLKRDDRNKIIVQIIKTYYALNNFNKVITWYKKTDRKIFTSDQKLLVAYAYLKLGLSQKAIELILQVEKNLFKIKDDDYLDVIRFLAYDYSALGNLAKAEYYFKKELIYEMNHHDKSGIHIIYAYLNFGYFYWVQKADFGKALELYHKAEYSLLRCPYSDNYYALPDLSKSTDINLLELAIKSKAESFYQLSKHCTIKTAALRYLKASLAHFELSLSLIQKIKQNLPEEEQQLVYSDLTKRKYPNIIKVCLELYYKTGEQHYADEAFEYAEKSKASLLLSMVQGINADRMHLVPKNLKEKEDRLQEQMVFLTRQQTEEYHNPVPDYTKIDQINMALFRLQFSHDSLVNIFKNQYKAYYNMRYNVEVATPESLQKIMAPNEAVLQYSVTWDFMVLFVVTRNQFRIFTDTIGKPFFADVEKYRKQLSSFDYTQLNDTTAIAFARLSNRLYQYLVQPAEPFIAGKKLLVIPDDVLNQVPFEALVAKLPASAHKITFGNMDYLIRHHPVSYSFSATLYSLNHAGTTFKNTRLLAVAPSYGGIAYKNLLDKDRNENRSNFSGLSTIAGTYREARNICKIFAGDDLLKKQATEKRFKKIAAGYDIIHLAMHGVIDNESPMFSKLIFAPPANPDSLNDGFLNTYEIYNMQINAPLVVLSACNTGSGKLHTGEGIISLARGFFTAGAKCVVMTLWSVADKSSSQLMDFFYENLAKKQPVSLALQQAKLNYLDHADMLTSHPYFWAGYIPTGNANVSFEVNETHKNYTLLGILAFLLVAGCIALFRFAGRH